MVTITYNSDNNTFYSGSSTGEVYVWQGNQCIKNYKLHEGSVMGLSFLNGKLFSSGAKDNLLKITQN